MLLYSIIMFLIGIPFVGISIAIYRGNTNLIHDYHQTKVTDPVAYAKAFGKSMFLISAALLLSGIIGLLGNSKKTMLLAIAVLFVGLIIGIVSIVTIQKKYNNGIF